MQLSRNRFDQLSVSNLAALNVQDAFFGGGSQVGAAANLQRRFEIQNFMSWSKGKHFLKIGGRLRWVGIDSVSHRKLRRHLHFLGRTWSSTRQQQPDNSGPLSRLEALNAIAARCFSNDRG